MKRLPLICLSAILLFTCSNSSDDPGGNNGNGNALDAPNGVQLFFPFENSLCNEGIDITPTQSTVLFEWEPNDNAEVYTLTLENLSNNLVEEFTTEDFILPITLDRATPYRWFVEYTHQGDAKQSDIWNFYNAGPGIQNYAPFPAEMVFPEMAQTVPATTSVNLQWNGSDLDDDIESYEVYFGTDASPEVAVTALIESEFAVSVLPGTIYYWYVVTQDSAGNSSESTVHQFRVAD
jgi:hypothetical protein